MNRTRVAATVLLAVCILAIVGCTNKSEQSAPAKPSTANAESPPQESKDSKEVEQEKAVEAAVEALETRIDWDGALHAATLTYEQRGEFSTLKTTGTPTFAALEPVTKGIESIRKDSRGDLENEADITRKYWVEVTVSTEPKEWNADSPAPTSVTMFMPLYQSSLDEPAGKVHHYDEQGPYGGLWDGENLVSLGGGYYLKLNHSHLAKVNDPSNTWERSRVAGVMSINYNGALVDEPSLSLIDVPVDKLVR